MRTRLEYRGESLPVMGCSFSASIHPPHPPFAGQEYDAWKKKLDESPEMLIALEIAFPRYYWRAQYIQQGNKPLYIVNFPAIGNVVQLKDCVFQNNVDLQLPDGTVIRGFPCDDMTAEAIEKNTAILVQEGLPISGNAELLARIARMDTEIKRIHEEHFNMLKGIKIAVAEMKPHLESVPFLADALRDAQKKPFDEAMKAANLIADRLRPESRALLYAMQTADGNQTYAAKELKLTPGAVNKKLDGLRMEILEAKLALPEFMLPPKERKRIADKPRKAIHKIDGIEIVDERTPADEVMENEEREQAKKQERGRGAE